MEDLIQIEKAAEEHLTIAGIEKNLSNKMKSLAKSELKQSKANETLAQKEFDLAKIRKEFAETNIDLVDHKLKIRQGGVLQFKEDEIKNNVNISIYNGKLAQIHEKFADVNKKIADLEKIIAEKRESIAYLILNVARIRVILARKQFVYIKSVRNQLMQEKIIKVEKEIETLSKDLFNERIKLKTQEEEIKKKENKLAELNKEASLILSEREKIRH
ncbi:MAG: hypothetical protein ACFFD2_23175 [Promethearchaeota archaeon]